MKTTKKRMTMKIVSIMLSIIMVVGILPIVVSATEPEQDMVYISASDDANYINDKNGSPMAYVGVSLADLAAIDLNEYGLGDYVYDADGDGNAEITALHLYIYTHTTIFGLDWNEVTVTGGAGSIYFAGGLFGFSDENLRYNYNGAYPADENGWGFTADRIVLSAGDYLDVAHFSDWSFYMDSAYGFHYFVDGSDAITHSYTVEEDTALSVKLMLVGGGMGSGDVSSFEAGYTISYGSSIGTATGTVTTDDSGVASITFSEAGTYYVWCDGGYGAEYPEAIVSSPANATVTVTSSTSSEPETPRVAQDVSATLDATLAQLAATVTEPAFGTNAGEWTVLCLARGEYYAKDNAYFADYYERIVETVNTTAASVNMNGALHKNKSTDNSRLIVALSAIGKDATSVGDWNLVEAYSANGFTWIKKQGINGAIWALIALDSNNYATTDTTIRQQCVDYILGMQLEDGGRTLSGTVADPDITGMTLQALYNYRDQEAVATACAEAITCLSNMQQTSGGFLYGTSETSESAAQVIVALTTWGINPDTDSRFVKSGKSVVDAILEYYVENEAMFEHQLGAGSNGMATDQATYALVAYDRFINGKTSLYNYSDVTFETVTPPATTDFSATLGLPENVENVPGTTFNGVVSVDGWDNEAGYKLIDMIVNVPEGLTVTGVTAGSRLTGGTLSYNLADGKLRIVYFDANANSDLTTSGNSFPIELFNITFSVGSVTVGDTLNITVTDMSLKFSSDSSDDASVENIVTDEATDSVTIVEGRTFSAGILYTGDGVDLIPADKKAVLVTVTQLEGTKKLTFSDGTNTIEFKYNAEIAEKMGVAAYVALVDVDIAIEGFENAENFTIDEADADSITFGDINGDGVINAQDALAAVDMWLRKGDAPTDDEILTANVNGDSRIDTYDALGIVEAFVYDDREYAIVTKASTIFD